MQLDRLNSLTGDVEESLSLSGPLVGGIVVVGNELWVPIPQSNAIVVIDTSTGQTITHPAGKWRPQGGIADGDVLWFAGVDLDGAGAEVEAVLRFDQATGERTEVVEIAARPSRPTAFDGAIRVSNSKSSSVSRIDPDLLEVQTIETDEGPVAPVVAGGSLWVANSGSNTIMRIHPADYYN